ncbi:hypothetical protein N0V82_007891 [Gnomoniopsis sp. IMI 355080]|nr:hypothetical protein N0V82_007891 [Gnomoniopsis sp. IMI 355080]
MTKVVESRSSFPVGTRENPIDVDGENHEHSRKQSPKVIANPMVKATRNTSRQLGARWKPSPVVLDVTGESPNDHHKFHHQLGNLKAAAKKRSSSEMAECGGLRGPGAKSAFLRASKWCRPYAKRPLPRFPTARIVFEKKKGGRYVRKRAFGNYPQTVLDPVVEASWEAHVSERVKRQAIGRMSSGRETLRQEMSAEEDLSLSQGDVSKKGQAVPFKMAITNVP